MKDLGQNFQTFDDARSRAVEILIAVGDDDAIALQRTGQPWQACPNNRSQSVQRCLLIGTIVLINSSSERFGYIAENAISRPS